VTDRLRIVVTGLIAQHPRLGGVAWDYVQYPLGLADLGHDVHYLEDSGEWPYVLDGDTRAESWIAHDPTPNIRHLAEVMGRFGLGERWMYRFPIEDRWYGLSDGRRAEVLASADLLINVSGTLEHPERYRDIPRLVYIDSDPVFTQAKLLDDERSDFSRRVDAHDVFLSFGERIGNGPFATRHSWKATRQPIVLSEWRRAGPTGDALTTVMSWTSYKPMMVRGLQLGQKDDSLRRFIQLPARSPLRLEIALGSVHHESWETAEFPGDAVETVGADTGAPDALLRRAGWTVIDALARCGTLDTYRSYVEGSRGEWSVAKSGYVVGASGWFSCRSACYLACGRPVVVQDTGFGPAIPAGAGVLSFTGPGDALEAIGEVAGRYETHARAAYEIAVEHFDSRKVLTRLLTDAVESGPSHGKGAER
jgi:hypothetical protein